MNIPLYNSDKVAVIDDEDYDKIKAHKWGINPDGYAITVIDRRTYFMHNFIFQVNPGEQPDHFDGDPLNNKKSNLRSVTQSVNQFNRHRLQRNNTSGHNGIHCRFRRVNGCGPYLSYVASIAGHKYQKEFKTLEQALAWRKQKLIELNIHQPISQT